MDLADQIAQAEATLSALRARAALSCKDGRHDWQFVGGCNAGCGEDCVCSVPVHRCASCGGYDYGENAEAERIVGRCRILQEDARL
jgi:hypothetical protein